MYDFRVRGICGSDTSLWVVSDKLLVYSALCIDYVNLDAAECRYGKVSEMSNGGGIEHKVDYGYDDIRSRHTIHFLSDEIDPRTNSILKTVPDGEVASVRVGNWEKTAKAESVTYRYKVDSTVAQILTLKYAIVFEDPGHPNIKDQPHFLLQIFDDISGEQILSDCASADFYARSGIDGWTTFRYQDRDIVWKNWTTLGINLGSLHDKTIRIKVSIFGCTLGAHYAYAYFTLGCSSGKLEGISCGDNPTTEFIAPDGFKYRWYEREERPGAM